MKKFLFMITMIVLSVVIGYSTYQLMEINRSVAQERELHTQLMPYRPMSQPVDATNAPVALSNDSYPYEDTSILTETDLDSQPYVNQSILDLQALYPDTVGWLRIPNTRIDYPFVQGVDNNQYLRQDMNQNQSKAGTLFLDFRNSKDLSDFNSIIYGHHMKSGSMFAALQDFDDQAFFDYNQTGTIFLENATYEIEIFAFAVVQPNDEIIYNSTIETDVDKIEFLDHLIANARHWRNVGVTENDRIITLSTCNYEWSNARMVLVGKLVEKLVES